MNKADTPAAKGALPLKRAKALVPIAFFAASAAFVLGQTAAVAPEIRTPLSLILIGFFAVAYIWLWRLGGTPRIEQVFAVCYITLGILALFAFLPFANIDGQEHYVRAFEIAQGEIFAHVSDGGLYATLPVGALPEGYDFYDNACMHIGNMLSAWDGRIDYAQTVEVSVFTQALYSPVSFLPSVLGIKIACLFTDSTWAIIYASRIANWLCIGLVSFFALKYLPIGKNLAALIALLPVNVQLCNSNSIDGMMIALCLAFTAIVLRHRFDSTARFTGKTVALLTVIALVIAFGKIVYVPIVALLLLIPTASFGTKARKYLTVIGIFLLASAADALWVVNAVGSSIEFMPGVDVPRQITLVLSDPLGFLGVIGSTVAQQAADWGWGLIGPMFYLWADDTPLVLANIALVTFSVLIVAVTLFDNDIKKVAFTKKMRVFFLAVVLAVFLLICASLYVQWSPVGADVIKGIQGRYFAPVLLLFLLALKPPRSKVGNQGLALCYTWYLVLFLDACLAITSLIGVL